MLHKLFVANGTYEITALNATNHKPNQELHTSLIKVNETIRRDSGISRETYENHQYAINSIARDLVGQRWWAGDSSHRCQQEDREGKKATPEQIARFPEDSDFREERNGHTNIFDQGSEKSNFEGTLFQREFDPNGNLATYRIFHQGHRDELSIRTVNIPALLNKIESFVAEFREEAPDQQLVEAYLHTIAEFNKLFGSRVMIEIIDNRAVVKFNANPQQVAERLVELGRANGMELTLREGSMSYVVSRIDDRNYPHVDLLLPGYLQGETDRFDPQKHKDTPAILLPYLEPKFANELVAMYATQFK